MEFDHSHQFPSTSSGYMELNQPMFDTPYSILRNLHGFDSYAKSNAPRMIEPPFDISRL